MVLVHFLLLAFLIIVLVKSSDFFVEAVARISKIFGVSELVIGLTVVAIGTSLPELASSLMASFAGETDLAIGNIVGSNIANMGLIIGVSAVFVMLKTNRKIFLRDGLIVMGISLLFTFLCIDGTLSQTDGLLLLIIVPIYLAYLFEVQPKLRARVYSIKGFLKSTYSFDRMRHTGMHKKLLTKALHQETYDDFVGKGFDLESYHKVRSRLSKFKIGIARDVAIVAGAIVLIYFSSRYLIDVAVELAESFAISTNVIGSTLIAMGTSLPEFSVSISSIRKGYANMLLGNTLGSNIFNMTLVGGIASAVAPMTIIPVTISLSLPFMLILTAALFVFLRSGWRIKRHEGIVLFSVYLIFLYLLIFRPL